MRALKVWIVVLIMLGIGSYLIGLISGEFNHFNGLLFYGSSNVAIVLLLICLFCLLLAISLVLILRAIKYAKSQQDGNVK